MSKRRRQSLFLNAAALVALVVSLTLIATGYFVGTRWLADKQSDSQDLLEIVATVVGTHISAAVAFDDQKTATETLASLSGYADITHAVLYAPDHQPFAVYQRAETDGPLAIPDWQPEGIQAGEATLSLYRPVDLGRGPPATLLLVADTRPLQSWVTSTLWLISAMILIAVVVVLVLLYVMARPLFISPLRKILTTTRQISANRDYSIRLTRNRDDELGELVDAINDMLATTEAHAADLNAAVKRAERADQAKSVFLSTMSHELRTPLNGVLGMAELLRRTDLTEQQKKYVEQSRNSGKDLLAILNDILDFSKIEAQRLDLEEIPFDLHDAIEMVTGLFQQQAHSKQILLTPEIDADAPHWVIGDPVRFRQIVANLVSNAIKFTARGEVNVHLQAGVGVGGIQVVVTDTGIGIDKSVLPQIFGAFSQADSSTTRQYGGTGLGLAIAAQLAKIMGGSLSVESELNRGSAFTLNMQLPLATRDDQRHTPQADHRHEDLSATRNASDNASRSILLAEDNLMNQALAQTMLEEMGHRVTAVSNGLDALQELETGQFDLVLMDGEMPIMDGYETTRKIRDREQQQGIPRQIVIAVTANAMSEAQQHCLAVGMDDYLSKPYTINDLQRTIDRWT